MFSVLCRKVDLTASVLCELCRQRFGFILLSKTALRRNTGKWQVENEEMEGAGESGRIQKWKETGTKENGKEKHVHSNKWFWCFVIVVLLSLGLGAGCIIGRGWKKRFINGFGYPGILSMLAPDMCLNIECT